MLGIAFENRIGIYRGILLSIAIFSALSSSSILACFGVFLFVRTYILIAHVCFAGELCENKAFHAGT